MAFKLSVLNDIGFCPQKTMPYDQRRSVQCHDRLAARKWDNQELHLLFLAVHQSLRTKELSSHNKGPDFNSTNQRVDLIEESSHLELDSFLKTIVLPSRLLEVLDLR